MPISAQRSISGTLNNQGSLFKLDGPNAVFSHSGNIAGGTVQVLNGASFTATGNSFLDGVTFEGDMEARDLNIVNGLALDGVIYVNHAGGTTPTVRFSGTQAFNTGTILLEQPAPGKSLIDATPGTTLTFGTPVVVEGAGDIFPPTGGQRYIVNNGTITANVSGQKLRVLADSITNNGELNVNNGGELVFGNTNSVLSGSGPISVDGGTLRIDGQYSSMLLSSINRTGGRIVAQGAISNTGGSINVTSASGEIEVNGTITGGDINIDPGQSIALERMGNFPSAHSTLRDVTINGDLLMNEYLGQWVIKDSFTLNGTARFSGDGTGMMFPDGFVLDSGGYSFEGSADKRNFIDGKVSIASGITVSGGEGSISKLTANEGEIIANRPGEELQVIGSNFVNHGLMEATNDGTLLLSGDWDNQGTIRVSGGQLTLQSYFNPANLGTIDYESGSFRLQGAVAGNSGVWTLTEAPWVFSNSTINKSEMVIPSGASVDITGVTGKFFQATVTGNFSLPDDDSMLVLDWSAVNGDIAMNGEDSKIQVFRNLTLGGALDMNAPGSVLQIKKDNTITGGTIRFNPAGGGVRTIEGFDAGILTLSDSTIVHGGAGVLYTDFGSTIINKGLVSADITATKISIYTERFQNEGTVEAVNGGMIEYIPPEFAGSGFENYGSVFVGSGSVLTIGANYTQGPGAELQIAIGYDALGSMQAGRARLLGAVELAGTLRVPSPAGAVYEIGDVFRLIKWDTGAVVGQFDLVELPTLDAPLYWQTENLYDTGRIRVVPAPGVGLAGMTALGMLIGRRRREGRSS